MITSKHIDLIAFIIKLKIQDLDETMKTDMVKHDHTLNIYYSNQRQLLKEYYMVLRKHNSCVCSMKVKQSSFFIKKSLWKRIFS